MANEERVNPFENLDLTETFKTKPKPKPSEVPSKAEINQVAKEAGFPSRQAASSRSRRYRTGRDIQMNMKVRQIDKDNFYLIADTLNLFGEPGVPLGKAFEIAIKAAAEKYNIKIKDE